MSWYYNMAGQRFELPERPLEPAEESPVRYCIRYGGKIYNGADTLCEECLEPV